MSAPGVSPTIARALAWLRRAEAAEATLVHLGAARALRADGESAPRNLTFAIHDGTAAQPLVDDDAPAFVRARPMPPRVISPDAPFEDAVVRTLGRLLKTTRWTLAVWLEPAHDAQDITDEPTPTRDELLRVARALIGCQHVSALHGWSCAGGSEPRARWYLVRNPEVEGGAHTTSGVLLTVDGQSELLAKEALTGELAPSAPAHSANLVSAANLAHNAAPVPHDDGARAEVAGSQRGSQRDSRAVEHTRAALTAAAYAWSLQREARLALYDEALYGASVPPLLEVGLSRDAGARRAWMQLLAAAVVLTRGGAARGGQDALPSAVSALRFADPFVEDLSTAGAAAAMETLLGRARSDQHALAASAWLAFAGPLCAIACELPDWVEGFLRAARRSIAGEVERLTRLRPASEAPSPVVLSDGAVCFLLRELQRRGVLERTPGSDEAACFVPSPAVHALALRLGARHAWRGGTFDDARALYVFFAQHTDDPTFGGDFDLPLWWLTTDPEAVDALF